MTAFRLTLRKQIAAAIRVQLTNVPVVEAREFPTATAELPMVIVQNPPHQRLKALTIGQPNYEAKTIIPVVVRVSASSRSAADNALEDILETVMAAPFKFLPFMQDIEEITNVEVHTMFTAEGSTHIGEAGILLECQHPAFFDPADGDAITAFQATITDQTTGDQIGSFEVTF